MLARPPLAVPYLFGVNSLQRHLRAAHQRGLSSNLYQSRGLSLDIDTIGDVQELSRAGAEGGAPARPLYGTVGIAS
jgi:2-phospho-L-lactate guanylyltransferase (CobY/MobA/RfbA family)